MRKWAADYSTSNAVQPSGSTSPGHRRTRQCADLGVVEEAEFEVLVDGEELLGAAHRRHDDDEPLLALELLHRPDLQVLPAQVPNLVSQLLHLQQPTR